MITCLDPPIDDTCEHCGVKNKVLICVYIPESGYQEWWCFGCLTRNL